MSDLQGYVVLAQFGREELNVSLIASSPEVACRRARRAMVQNRRDIRWMDATYEVIETVSLEEFKAGREAGTR